MVKAINAKGFAGITTGQIEELTDMARVVGAKGLAFIKVENGEWKSPIVKFFSEAEKAGLAEHAWASRKATCFSSARTNGRRCCNVLGRIRLRVAEIQQFTCGIRKS